MRVRNSVKNVIKVILTIFLIKKNAKNVKKVIFKRILVKLSANHVNSGNILQKKEAYLANYVNMVNFKTKLGNPSAKNALKERIITNEDRKHVINVCLDFIKTRRDNKIVYYVTQNA